MRENYLKTLEPTWVEFLGTISDFLVTYITPILGLLGTIMILKFVFSGSEIKSPGVKDVLFGIIFLGAAVLFEKIIVPNIPFEYSWVVPIIGFILLGIVIFYLIKRMRTKY